MNRLHKFLDSLPDFFRDDKGKLAIAQPPNGPIVLWFGFLIASWLTSGETSDTLSFIARLVLFVWACLEVLDGYSPFRKTLGGVVLLYIAISLLMQLL